MATFPETATGVDGSRQAAHAAVGGEAVALAQHGNRLIQWLTIGVNQAVGHAFRQGLAGSGAEPVGGGRGVMARLGPGAQVAQHRAGFHRGQLVLVAEQHQARVGRQGVEHGGHHADIDHRGLVYHQHVQRQRIMAMVAKAPGVRTRAEQPVQRADFGRNHPLQVGYRTRDGGFRLKFKF